MSGVALRTAVPEDAGVMGEITRTARGAAQWKAEDYATLLQAGGGGLVAEAGGAAVGFIAWRRVGEEAELLNVAVAAGERRRGVGGSLVAEMMARLREEGVAEVYLEVHEGNRAARGLYESAGFREAGRRKGYYRLPAGDAVLMRRRP